MTQPRAYRKWLEYVEKGGKLDYWQWVTAGMPPAIDWGKALKDWEKMPPKWQDVTTVKKAKDIFLEPEKTSLTEVPLPPGVTLTGETKFSGMGEYEKGSDGKWYRISTTEPTPAEPIPTGGMSEDLEWFVPMQVILDRATGKYFDAANRIEITPSQAAEISSAYQRGISPPTTPTPWQPAAEAASLAEQKRQFDIQQAWREQQAAAEPELQRQRFELQWEIDRQRLLAGIASDDWVTQWVVQNQPNPYKQPAAPTITSELPALEAQLDRQTGQVQALEQIAVSRGLAMGWDSEVAQKASAEMEEAQKQRDATYKAWKGAKDETRDWSPQPVPAPYPPAPEWLPKYAPGQVAGRMITAENVVTPSGQQLTQMPASTAGKLGYFADWTAKMGAGRPWRDILTEAEIMQPRSPSFGRTRWTPVGR